MDQQEKLKLATELLEFTHRSLFSGRPPFSEAMSNQRNRLISLLTEVTAETYSDENLRAHLDFYRGPHGTSILETLDRMQVELKRRFSETAEERADSLTSLGTVVAKQFSEGATAVKAMVRTLDLVTQGCSFCGKGANESKKLIAGPAAAICDECIVQSHDILKEEGIL